ncbi:Hsp20/alpha crystallin family protein [Pararobbsia alpina]|uniref:Spore protein SP21 n=1 Tax=Pararobbsia alpina TaxID=621374 RepID=A0A6S7B789_9BURK|nr:Hsp20/alpha crystallin family protein [Pararobbsia alpina]CAB3790553.1 Spore protein SP21 [Pararobbsia alpina]
MSEETQLATREPQNLSTRSAVAALIPPVDIVEDETGITITADLPGASRDRLEIKMEGEHLLIEAEAAVAVSEGLQLLHAEILEPRYRRAFRLSRELDGSKIEASLKDGVLTLRIPRIEQAQPRRIEVQVE